jgi:hypothetical protein
VTEAAAPLLPETQLKLPVRPAAEVVCAAQACRENPQRAAALERSLLRRGLVRGGEESRERQQRTVPEAVARA